MPKPTKGKRLGGSSSHEDQIISNLIMRILSNNTPATIRDIITNRQLIIAILEDKWSLFTLDKI